MKAISGSCLVLFLILISSILHAQYDFYSDDLLTSDFHKKRRVALRERLDDNTAAIIFSNPVRNRSNDVDFVFSQNPDLYYLSGMTEPHSVLVIFKEQVQLDGIMTDEAMYILDKDPGKEIWDGKRLGPDSASSRLGIQYIRPGREFSELEGVLSALDKVFMIPPKVVDMESRSKSSLGNYVSAVSEWMDEGVIVHNDPSRLRDILDDLREIKTEEELKLLKKAIDITVAGLDSVIRKIKPGMTEYQVQATAEYHFRMAGSQRQGYGSICGSGPNSCILHYISNRRTTLPGDLILMDIGAEYHGYTADITRTVPVNGKFSREQRLIYDLVLEAQEAALQEVKPGNPFRSPHRKAINIIDEGLMELGITTKKGEYMKYFMHGTSHYLGLDVHDAGTYGPLRPGSVITIEPGVYIAEGSPCDPKWWNIGIRIEDDVLVTESGHENLSSALPKTAESIENMMVRSRD